MNALVMLAPLILIVLIRAIVRGIEEARGNTCDASGIRMKPIKLLKEVSPPKKIVEEKPIKMQGKFPEWVNGLSQRELFDLLYTSPRDRPEEAMRIISGGETFWLSGYRTDDEFSYSDNGGDLFPVTIYHN